MAMTLKNPASDLADALHNTTVAGVALVKGDNLFYRRLHPMPMGLVVQLLNSGGLTPEPYLSPTASAYYRPTVQVLVFGMPGEDGYTSAEALARALVGELQQRSVAGYVSVVVNESQPNELGADPETQRHQWSFNVEATYVA